MKKIVFILICAVCCTQFSMATVLAVWDFGASSAYYTESPTYYNIQTVPTLVLAGGTKDANGKDGVNFTDEAGVVHAAGQSAAWDDIKVSGNPSASWVMTLDTTGFEAMSIRWDYRSEKAISFDLAYRLNSDGTWAQLFDNYAITPNWSAGTWNSVTLDLSGFTFLNNQSYVQFRLDDLVEGPGNDKFAFDNLQLTGIPEPAAILILGLGGVILRKFRISA